MTNKSYRKGNQFVNFMFKDFKHYNTDDMIYEIHYKGKDYKVTIHKEETSNATNI